MPFEPKLNRIDGGDRTKRNSGVALSFCPSSRSEHLGWTIIRRFGVLKSFVFVNNNNNNNFKSINKLIY